MTSTAVKNKARGRKFQSKLAQLARGKNIGTLGGEDISHEMYSYEAKTYAINTPTHKGRPWVGEALLYKIDQGESAKRFAIVGVESVSFSGLVLLRWHWWDKIISTPTSIPDKRFIETTVVDRFIGNTYMNQAEKNCPDAKVPVVVVHTVGSKHINDVVVLRRVYWLSILDKTS